MLGLFRFHPLYLLYDVLFLIKWVIKEFAVDLLAEHFVLDPHLVFLIDLDE